MLAAEEAIRGFMFLETFFCIYIYICILLNICYVYVPVVCSIFAHSLSHAYIYILFQKIAYFARGCARHKSGPEVDMRHHVGGF